MGGGAHKERLETHSLLGRDAGAADNHPLEGFGSVERGIAMI